ncbi:MAG TPA: NmrA/HSCARG family protein [Ktedonobacteraceae bacterium]
MASHLLKDGWKVRAQVRNAKSDQAQALGQRGIELVQGDLNQPSSLLEAMKGAYGVFSVQTIAEGGTAAETRQGKAVADAAREARVRHLVYSSVGGAERQSGIAHFESKWQIEEYIRALGLPATILRPVFFMSNLFRYSGIKAEADGTLTPMQALHPQTRLQMIAVEDIGAFAALAFAHPETFLGQAIEISGDALTPLEMAERLERATGKPTRFVELPLEQLRSFDAETGNMYAWLNQSGYQADLPALYKLHPGLLTLEAWLRQTDWLAE